MVPAQEPDSSLQHVLIQATRNLHTLVRLYYLRHGYEAMDLFIVIPLMLMASDCIESIGEQTAPAELEVLQSTLILMAKGLHDQRRNHYLAEALFRVIRGRMRPAELSLFRSVTSIDAVEEEDPTGLSQAVISQWPVSVVTNKEEVDQYMLSHLVEKYGNLQVGDENAE